MTAFRIPKIELNLNLQSTQSQLSVTNIETDIE